ncbi:type II toxin-antitoxin system VapC family toxin [Duganella sp. BJB488]|uniref:PIN domain-containing protein n=1 Tax=unclassified Duganella TaxID=2636909 RepID=UPI000E34B63C|nr:MULTISPECIES: PIN domain-containing protein [unclassified Duganella]RFP25847.1 type II toxin-antitoxin system VapC family toxin [Duganella sp. BJB489]RFP28412.1 type II toxin-antitoxin system VapC family toxin [Duganella sp. BJB488]RFP36777.1 type II toxin-antitoxin system VapC family toxin [Duganella sp. BJB480]
MKYLLDTCTVSDLIRGYGAVGQRFRATPSDELAISAITRMEREYGLALSPARAARIENALNLHLSRILLLLFDEDDAKEAGKLRASLRISGCPIGPYDLQIAGCALARNLILVTSNTREFGRVQGLRLENWR